MILLDPSVRIPRPGRELRELARRARAPRVQPIIEWSEQNIVVPNGPRRGPFRALTFPHAYLYLYAIQLALWRRYAALGPTQSGKTFACYVIPVLWHLFEHGEDVVAGVPNLDIAADKWREDLEPVIAASKYRALLPKTGPGSRGGAVRTHVAFQNGATLRFMAGGGGDKQRAGYTARVVAITEVDGLDESAEKSEEADKVTQLEVRTKAFGAAARTYLECTVTTDEGRIWQEYAERGTATQIVCRCPDCRQLVEIGPRVRKDEEGKLEIIGRDDLQGWQDAKTVVEARERSRWVCPACSAPWSEAQRRQANREAELMHKGQRLEGGEIVGDPTPTDTFGFRYSSVNNVLETAGDHGVEEWAAQRAHDEDNADRKLCQFVHAVPPKSLVEKSTDVSVQQIMERTTKLGRGFVPADARYLTVAIDLGKWRCRWVAIAVGEGFRCWVVDYGELRPDSHNHTEEVAVRAALREFRDQVLREGWAGDAKQWRPDRVYVDSKWLSTVAYEFAKESNQRGRPAVYFASQGFGASERDSRGGRYSHPRKRTKEIREIGDGWYRVLLRNPTRSIVHVNADQWKTFVHRRLSGPVDEPGALTLFQASHPMEHSTYAKQLLSEIMQKEHKPGVGDIVVWRVLSRQNHYLDATYNALAAAHHAGARLVGEEKTTRKSAGPRKTLAEAMGAKGT